MNSRLLSAPPCNAPLQSRDRQEAVRTQKEHPTPWVLRTPDGKPNLFRAARGGAFLLAALRLFLPLHRRGRPIESLPDAALFASPHNPPPGSLGPDRHNSETAGSFGGRLMADVWQVHDKISSYRNLSCDEGVIMCVRELFAG